MLKGLIAPHDTLEWKECLRVVGVVIRDETGELFHKDGRSIVCKECGTKLTVDNVGLVCPGREKGEILFYCTEPFCHIMAFDNVDEIADELEIVKFNMAAEKTFEIEKKDMR